MIFKKIFHFFDILEDRVRARLSKTPIIYALFGGVGIVLFWRGVWHTVDEFLFWSGPVSLIVGSVILLITGVFVSSFVGSRLIISGIKGEHKLAEKTEEKIKEEFEEEESELKKVENTLKKMEKEISEIKEDIQNSNK